MGKPWHRMDHLQRTSTRPFPYFEVQSFRAWKNTLSSFVAPAERLDGCSDSPSRGVRTARLPAAKKIATAGKDPFGWLNLHRGQMCMTVSGCLPKLPTQPGNVTSSRFQIRQTAKNIYIAPYHTLCIASICCSSLGMLGGSMSLNQNYRS